jgi:hypothetical protein
LVVHGVACALLELVTVNDFPAKAGRRDFQVWRRAMTRPFWIR